MRSPLLHLDLRSDHLSGGVPPLPGTLVYLLLTGNRISGPVGAALRQLPRLSFLDLGRNWFSGEVPGEVFVFSRIRYLQLRKNAFSGELRPAGRVPPGATVASATTRSLAASCTSSPRPPPCTSTATRRIPPSLLQLRDLCTLVLSHNALTGEIPMLHPDIQGEEGEHLTTARR